MADVKTITRVVGGTTIRKEIEGKYSSMEDEYPHLTSNNDGI